MNGAIERDGPGWLGLNWQLSLSSGWGIAGVNMARVIDMDGRFKAVPLLPSAQLEHSSGAFEPLVAKLQRREHEVAKALGQAQKGRLVCDFPVIHSVGNEIHGEDMPYPGMPERVGSRNFAVVFFEFNSPSGFTTNNAKKFDVLFGGSTWNSTVLKQHGLANVDTFLQGVDLEMFHPRAKTPQERFVVFSGGKLEFRKGQDIVIAAFREFVKTHRDAVLATTWHNPWPKAMNGIVEAGMVEGVPQKNSDGEWGITEWAGDNGVPADNFHDHGLVANHLMPEVFAQADVALFPNRCEGGTNLVAMEAMASGVPCILSANTGHMDLINDDNCYPLLKQSEVTSFTNTNDWGESDVAEVVEILERIYTDRQEAKRRGKQAAMFMRDWSWEKRTAYLLNRII
ncbi:MAG: glycosyltransferase family 4 protein [Verrucomicrobia bacterium]|nr:glycosyltransferase family 4 protein [Verrucomicrobiota bacterium]